MASLNKMQLDTQKGQLNTWLYGLPVNVSDLQRVGVCFPTLGAN